MITKSTLLKAIAVIIFTTELGQVAAEDPITSSGFCRPHAAQRALQHFGRDDDFLTLVDEMDASRESGTSFDSLLAVLESRGLYCRAYDVGRVFDLQWNGPVIVHTNMIAGGHFCVLLPRNRTQKAGFHRIALSPSETIEISDWQLSTWRSKVVALVSDKPITNGASAFKLSFKLSVYMCQI